MFRIKKVHTILIGTFLGPFLLTFITVLFLLVMQFIWKHIDDFMGKGLEWYVIAELLIYTSANLVAMAFPLAILLSSIMTFGELSEHYELVAMKSSGMSLLKILYPLIILVGCLAIGAFLFAKEVAPRATLKSRTLLYDVTQQKPALELKEGVFYNEIEGFSIRVKKKHEDTGLLEDVLIYDHTKNHPPNKKVIRAERGTMRKEPGFLIMDLYDGVSYDLTKEMKKNRQVEEDLFLKQKFERQEIRFDLSSFAFERSAEDLFKNSYQMLPNEGLLQHRDSLTKKLTLRKTSYDDYIFRTFHLLRDTTLHKVHQTPIEPLYVYCNQNQFLRGFDLAQNFARNARSYVSRYNDETYVRQNKINRFIAEYHTRFGVAIGCLLLFFIGAPIGALIKKGGLGLPVVFSVVFFLIYHVVSITGKKMVIGNVATPEWGMWIAAYVLAPIAFFLTYKSNKDSSLFDSVFYTKMLTKIKALFKK